MKDRALALVLFLALVLAAMLAIAEPKAEEPEAIAPEQVEHQREDGPKAEMLREVIPEEAEPEETTWRDEISEYEVDMLAQTVYAEAQGLRWTGDAYGMSYHGRQAAVAWVALNRLDNGHYGDSLKEVLSAPNQFAWRPDTKVTEDMHRLVEDVLDKWWAEKNGCASGRTLPVEYLYFAGANGENHFREDFDSEETWAWTLPDPYKEGL